MILDLLQGYEGSTFVFRFKCLVAGPFGGRCEAMSTMLSEPDIVERSHSAPRRHLQGQMPYANLAPTGSSAPPGRLLVPGDSGESGTLGAHWR